MNRKLKKAIKKTQAWLDSFSSKEWTKYIQNEVKKDMKTRELNEKDKKKAIIKAKEISTRGPDSIELWDIDQVSEHLNCSVSFIYKLIGKKKIPHIKLGPKIIRFWPNEIKKWVKDNMVESI